LAAAHPLVGLHYADDGEKEVDVIVRKTPPKW
jgi:hypothetical protein